jgi:hypothetical protein
MFKVSNTKTSAQPSNAELFDSINTLNSTVNSLVNYIHTNVATKADLENYVTKHEFTDFRDEVLTSQDKILTIVKDLKEDHPATIQWLKRHNQILDQYDQKDKEQDHEIHTIKTHLKLA